MKNKMPKIRPHKNIIDLYNQYPEKDSITKQEFKLVLRTFNYLLMQSIIETGKLYYLPNNLGVIGVFRIPVIGRGVFDYQLYKKEGIKVWKKNLHSSSYSARFMWRHKYPRSLLPFHILRSYRWEAPRYWKRHLAKCIKDKNSINLYIDKHDY